MASAADTWIVKSEQMTAKGRRKERSVNAFRIETLSLPESSLQQSGVRNYHHHHHQPTITIIISAKITNITTIITIIVTLTNITKITNIIT